jgi:glutamyl-tRNA synthetase
MQAMFDLEHVSRGVSSFNYDKLYWLNQHYQKSDPVEQVAQALAWHFQQKGIDINKGPSLDKLVAIQAERCKTLAEMCEMSQYFYRDTLIYDDNAVKKHLRPVILDPLTTVFQRFKTLTVWEQDPLQEIINDVSAEFDINMSKIAQPLRVAVTGTGISPSIDATLMLLGKERVLARLEIALQKIQARSANA